MIKWHVNKDNLVKPCNADVRDCPYKHFDSPRAAEKYVESLFANEKLMSLSKKSLFFNASSMREVFSRTRAGQMVAIGGVVVMTISVGNFVSSPSASEVREANIQKHKDSLSEAYGEDYVLPEDETLTDEARARIIETRKKLEENTTNMSVDELLNNAEKQTKGLKNALDDFFKNKQEQKKAPSSDVLWMGGGMRPKPEEVKLARERLSQLKVRPEYKIEYNRVRDYGNFESGIVGEIEHRDIPNATFAGSSIKDRALSGDFIDPYTGEKVIIIKGSSTDTNVDHIVALKEANDSGAMNLSKQERRKLANDPDNLIITSASANKDKTHYDAREWLPSYEPAQCKMVIAQIHVKTKYDLNVDPAEQRALANILEHRCNQE